MSHRTPSRSEPARSLLLEIPGNPISIKNRRVTFKSGRSIRNPKAQAWQETALLIARAALPADWGFEDKAPFGIVTMNVFRKRNGPDVDVAPSTLLDAFQNEITPNDRYATVCVGLKHYHPQAEEPYTLVVVGHVEDEITFVSQSLNNMLKYVEEKHGEK